MIYLNPKNSFIGAHRWEPDRKTKILIFDKISGQLVKEYKMEAMFAFHHINAFENHLDQIDNCYLLELSQSVVMFAGVAV